MPTDRELNEIKKAMAYDLIDIIESAQDKEIKALIKAYITGVTK